MKFLLSAAVILIVALMSVAALDDEVSDRTVYARRNEMTEVPFRRLYRRVAPGMVVTLTSPPTNGALFAKPNGEKQLSIDSNTDDNVFYYRSNADFPMDGTPSAKDSFGVKIEVQGKTYTAQITVVVHQRTLVTKNYTLYSVDTSEPRVIALRVRTALRGLINLLNPVLADVRIDSLPTNGCRVTQFDGTEIADAKTKVTDVELRVKVWPRVDMVAGETCSFTFTALRRNGIRTEPNFVTLVQSEAFVPRAYNTNVAYEVDADVSRSVELIGSTRNPNQNLSFVITKLPEVGQLYDVAETSVEGLPEFGLNSSQLPIVIYSGPKTRVVLVYRVSPKDVTFPHAPVTVEYVVKDRFKTSAGAKATIKLVRKASPVCGSVVVTPVFWDRPAKELVLNYTEVNGNAIQKLVLIQGPTSPLGDLIFLRTTIRGVVRKALKVGDYFTDKDKRLSYLVRGDRMRDSGNETYKFRAQSFDGLSCVGSITFVVMQHDAPVTPQGVAVRRELVRLKALTLLPMWGKANLTIANPTSVVITKAPVLGSLFQVKDSAPYEPGQMYRVDRRGAALSYCRRRDCEQYKGERIDEGSTVQQMALWSQTSLESNTRIWVLYESPKWTDPSLAKQTDSYEFYFTNKNGDKSETQQVVISFRKALKRVISIRYSLAQVTRNLNFDHQQETLVKCVLSNYSNQAVMIPEFDKYRRHGAQVNFRLFQYRQDGNRLINGARLVNTTRDDVTGWWLDNENSLVLIPGARARQQIFQFRARIYNVSAAGTLMKDTMEEVRVVVTRDNTVPEWNFEYITGQGNTEVLIGELKEIQISAFDADDDLLSFRVADGVKRGALYYEETRFGLVTMSMVKTGAVLRIPKGAVTRSDARMHYKAIATPGMKFPAYDNFTLYADDGGGVLSERLMFNITIVGDITTHASVNTTPGKASVSLISIVIALLAALSGVLIMVVMIVRKRKRTQRYLSVPQETEMS